MNIVIHVAPKQHSLKFFSYIFYIAESKNGIRFFSRRLQLDNPQLLKDIFELSIFFYLNPLMKLSYLVVQHLLFFVFTKWNISPGLHGFKAEYSQNVNFTQK